MKCFRKGFSAALAAMLVTVLCLTGLSFSADATSLSDYSAGIYELDAELSCYVNAMGGVEFGGPLLIATVLTVEDDGSAWITLYLTKSSVTIYSVTCDTFVDAAPSYVTDDRGVTSGTIGYYDADGVLITEGVSYTLSDDTALNPNDDEVHYVSSITFPLTYESDSYALTLYVNSNVMGVQFCEENDDATSSTYPATLTVYWDGVTESGDGEEDVDVVASEEMDGLTIYRSDDQTDEDEENSEAAVEEESAQEEGVYAKSFLFGNVSRSTLIVILICGVVLIGTGVSLLTANLLSGNKKEEDVPNGKA